MAQYVDVNDLAYLMTLIRDGFVQKEEGKGLSSNDFTDKYKAILDAIAEGDYTIGGDKACVHVQSDASNSWTIIHNLGKYPSVTIADRSGVMVMGDIVYIDRNTVRVDFTSPFAGNAYLN